jgi:DNA transposition AAA+ family ATPase
MTTDVNHFSGLEGARTIKTQQFLLTKMAVDHCVKRKALGVFTGPAGRGKTFSIESATRDLAIPVVRTLFGSQTNRKEVARALLSETDGFARKGTYYELSEELVDVFARPHVAVIDEAQHLNQDCTFFLRYLLDHPQTQVAILLVGADGLMPKIKKDPTLQSRIYRRVEFAPLPRESLLKALPNYHSIYHGVDKELLEELIDRCNISELRALAVFTLTASDLLADKGLDRLDNETIEQSRALISGGM